MMKKGHNALKHYILLKGLTTYTDKLKATCVGETGVEGAIDGDAATIVGIVWDTRASILNASQHRGSIFGITIGPCVSGCTDTSR